MYADGASRLAGDQWEEGDVSCSVIRRVILPDAFYSIDGLCETVLTVLNQMGPYPVVIEKEYQKYSQFLATTEVLMIAVKAGIGREKAHETIKKYAVAEALAMREGKLPELADKLASDPEFKKAGITKEKIEKIFADKMHFVGNAKKQILEVEKKAKKLISKYPKEAKYEAGDIL
jgi:adenylosuccinate lyase